MTDLVAMTDNRDEEEERYDFDAPEDVLIQVEASTIADHTIPMWAQHEIVLTSIIAGPEGVSGAATYDHIYGNFLNYTIENMIECPGEGWFVVTGITGHYMRGDGWTTDDDMDFYYEGVRRATPDEIEMA